MQVSATLIAAQQAAREARARLQVPQPAPQAAQVNFTAALEKTSGGFSPLPLKQAASVAAPTPAQPQTQALARMGTHVDITV